MRRSILALTVAAALFPVSGALAADLQVPLDQSLRVALSGSAADVFVGNAEIADVSVIDRSSILVTGKGYGTTSLMVIDGAGRTLYNRTVIVGAPGNVVLVQRGVQSSTYNCAGVCQVAQPATTPAAATPTP